MSSLIQEFCIERLELDIEPTACQDVRWEKVKISQKYYGPQFPLREFPIVS